MLFVAEARSFSYNAGSSIRVLSECVYIYLNSEKVGYAFACAVVTRLLWIHTAALLHPRHYFGSMTFLFQLLLRIEMLRQFILAISVWTCVRAAWFSNEKTDGPTERSLSSQCECVLSFTNIQTAENVFKSAVETAFIRHLDSCVGLRFG